MRRFIVALALFVSACSDDSGQSTDAGSKKCDWGNGSSFNANWCCLHQCSPDSFVAGKHDTGK